MLPALPLQDEDPYNSASDSDFEASLSLSSGDESETSTTAADGAKKGKKRKTDADGDVDMGSGDEGIVAQGRKKRRLKGKGKGNASAEDVDGEDEDGEGAGIRVRLRSGRGGEESKRALPKTSGATIDIDSVWARLNNPHASKATPDTQKTADATSSNAENIPRSSESVTQTVPAAAPSIATPEATITIPHTYTFAGQTHISTKTVPVSAPEAQAHLSSRPPSTSSPSAAAGPTLRRPLARKYLLDPNPTRLILGRPIQPRADLPTSIGGKGTTHLAAGAVLAGKWKGEKEKGRKLNTVEKSKLDWEEEVERRGMREELEKAEKSGGSYLGRMEFLGRGERRREEEGRLARLKLKGVAG